LRRKYRNSGFSDHYKNQYRRLAIHEGIPYPTSILSDSDTLREIQDLFTKESKLQSKRVALTAWRRRSRVWAVRCVVSCLGGCWEWIWLGSPTWWWWSWILSVSRAKSMRGRVGSGILVMRYPFVTTFTLHPFLLVLNCHTCWYRERLAAGSWTRDLLRESGCSRRRSWDDDSRWLYGWDHICRDWEDLCWGWYVCDGHVVCCWLSDYPDSFGC